MQAAGEDVIWQAEGARTHACDLVRALPDGDGVRLHIGRATPVADPPGARAALASGEIALSAQTARNLRTLLARLIADADAAKHD